MFLFSGDDTKGLVGGRADLRVSAGRPIDIDHPAFFDLYGPRRLVDQDRAKAFVEARDEGPLQIEIGFGRGLFLSDLAAARPDERFLGFEVRTRNALSLLDFIERKGLSNVRVVLADVRSVLPWLIPDAAVEAVYMLFPDPWWKKRHHKRRLLEPRTLSELHRVLRPGAPFLLKTDVPETAALADEAFAASKQFERADAGVFDGLPRSHRERRCLRVGLPVLRRAYSAIPCAPDNISRVPAPEERSC